MKTLINFNLIKTRKEMKQLRKIQLFCRNFIDNNDFFSGSYWWYYNKTGKAISEEESKSFCEDFVFFEGTEDRIKIEINFNVEYRRSLKYPYICRFIRISKLGKWKYGNVKTVEKLNQQINEFFENRKKEQKKASNKKYCEKKQVDSLFDDMICFSDITPENCPFYT